jgi:hydrogenase/urease accessory protein HupE
MVGIMIMMEMRPDYPAAMQIQPHFIEMHGRVAGRSLEIWQEALSEMWR